MAIPVGLIDRIGKLTPLPVTVQRLTAAVVDGEVPIAKIAEIMEYDQAIAANVLRLANSSFYAALGPVGTLRDAAARVGTGALLNLAMDQHLNALRVDAPMYELTENDLWIHGAACSLAIEEIVRESVADVPQIASAAALIHDVGKLVIVRYLKADVSTLLAVCDRDGISFVEAERRILGCDHAEVGGAVARHWRFSEETIRAVEEHHRVPLDNPAPILDAVILANLVAKTLGAGLGAEGMNFDLDVQVPRRLGIDTGTFCRIVLKTSLRLRSLSEAYGYKGLYQHVTG
jgi:HD-like signal output (HDOD) protein